MEAIRTHEKKRRRSTQSINQQRIWIGAGISLLQPTGETITHRHILAPRLRLFSTFDLSFVPTGTGAYVAFLGANFCFG